MSRTAFLIEDSLERVPSRADFLLEEELAFSPPEKPPAAPGELTVGRHLAGLGTAVATGLGRGALYASAPRAAAMAVAPFVEGADPSRPSTKPRGEGLAILERLHESGALEAMDADEVYRVTEMLKRQYGEEPFAESEALSSMRGIAESTRQALTDPVGMVSETLREQTDIPSAVPGEEYVSSAAEFAMFGKGIVGRGISALVGLGTHGTKDAMIAAGANPTVATLASMAVPLAHGVGMYRKDAKGQRQLARGLNAANDLVAQVGALEGVAIGEAAEAQKVAQSLLAAQQEAIQTAMRQRVNAQVAADELTEIASEARRAGAEKAAQSIQEASKGVLGPQTRTAVEQEAAIRRAAAEYGVRKGPRPKGQGTEDTARLVRDKVTVKRNQEGKKLSGKYEGFWKKHGDKTVSLSADEVGELRDAFGQVERRLQATPAEAIEGILLEASGEEIAVVQKVSGQLQEGVEVSARDLNEALKVLNRELYTPQVVDGRLVGVQAGDLQRLYQGPKRIIQGHLESALGKRAFNSLQSINGAYTVFKGRFDSNPALRRILNPLTTSEGVLAATQLLDGATVISEQIPTLKARLSKYHAHDLLTSEGAFSRWADAEYMQSYDSKWRETADSLNPVETRLTPKNMVNARSKLLTAESEAATPQDKRAIRQAIDSLDAQVKDLPSKAGIQAADDAAMREALTKARQTRDRVEQLAQLRETTDRAMGSNNIEALKAGYKIATQMGMANQFADAVLEGLISRFKGARGRPSAIEWLRTNRGFLEQVLGRASGKSVALAAEMAPLLLASREQAASAFNRLSPRLQQTILEKTGEVGFRLQGRAGQRTWELLTEPRMAQIENEIFKQAASNPVVQRALERLNEGHLSPESIERLYLEVFRGAAQ